MDTPGVASERGGGAHQRAGAGACLFLRSDALYSKYLACFCFTAMCFTIFFPAIFFTVNICLRRTQGTLRVELAERVLVGGRVSVVFEVRNNLTAVDQAGLQVRLPQSLHRFV